MTIPAAILLFLAAVVAGALNAVAGGGSFFTFPALLFTGVPAIPANATSTVAVWPGSVASAAAYRKHLPENRRVTVPLLIASLAGGLTGAGLLLHTPRTVFLRLIPFLFFGATLLFVFSKRIARRRVSAPDEGERDADQPSWVLLAGASLAQFFIAVYGGFFGGGMGILMLALLALLPLGGIHAMNGFKNILATMINGIAIVAFVVARIIYWPQGILMVVGAVLGGYGGAHYAQKVNPALIRKGVIIVGFTMAIIFFWKYR